MQNYRTVYSRGTNRIPTTYWRVERVYRTTFRTVAYIRVAGRTVEDEMDRARSIHHHEPSDIARRIAHRRFPDFATCVTPAEYEQWRRWTRHVRS